MNPKLALALVCVCAPCWAQTAPAPTAKPLLLVDERVDRAEPNVKHTVIEDGGSKIDELVVRGQVQHVVVTPKVGVTKPYEIIVSRSGREPVDGTGGANSAVGKRVWNVLAF
ncbi:MAG: hypothetical protein V4750_18810 [Pseudomonadota bacterium]